MHAILDRTELRRLGLVLTVRVDGGAPQVIEPIGPAVQRDFALPITIAPGDGATVSVELTFTPTFWEIDRVALAEGTTPLTPTTVLPTRAVGHGERDVTSLLTSTDGERVELTKGQHVDLWFTAPALAPGSTRTDLELDASYEMQFGGRAGLDPLSIAAHRAGWESLPRFAAALDREARR